MTYSFTVTGRGAFPTDMLRYDACWPTDMDSVLHMDVKGEMRSVNLRSTREPTVGRWASFMWKVTEVRKGR